MAAGWPTMVMRARRFAGGPHGRAQHAHVVALAQDDMFRHGPGLGDDAVQGFHGYSNSVKNAGTMEA
jgi:hypothetical protein